MHTSVILYYKYIHLPDTETVHLSQRRLCERLGLKGRILLAEEGVNGTLAGTPAAIDEYIRTMSKDQYFSGVSYKRDECDYVPFPRLRIRVRAEIVTLGIDVDPSLTAPKLTPAEFNQIIQDPDVVLFDARNGYESAIGKFKGAITPDIQLFKDLPQVLPEYESLKDKTIVTYCTGGIRCEKASALMRTQGFKNVYQLEGGIIEYAKAYPDGAFEGECFVFDERMSVGFKPNPEILGKCRICGDKTSSYKNCANLMCHDLILFCSACDIKRVTCSDECEMAVTSASSHKLASETA
jgi:UPF0176 protein